MLQLFPFATWLAPATSAVMLVMLIAAGDLRVRGLVAFLACFMIAMGCQFGGGTSGLKAAGLSLQTLLAVVLILRWRVGG